MRKWMLYLYGCSCLYELFCKCKRVLNSVSLIIWLSTSTRCADSVEIAHEKWLSTRVPKSPCLCIKNANSDPVEAAHDTKFWSSNGVLEQQSILSTPYMWSNFFNPHNKKCSTKIASNKTKTATHRGRRKARSFMYIPLVEYKQGIIFSKTD